VIGQTAIAPDAEQEARWRAWQGRGSKRDRRRARSARWVMTAIGLALAAWLIVELIAA
jgi:hypothetical protein